MKYLKREPRRVAKKGDEFLKAWELNFLLTLIILLVMATIVDLNISFEHVLRFIIH